MPVTEQLMLMGSWELGLIDDTPKADIRDKLDFFGHIFLLDSRVAVNSLADADFQSKARYVGVLRVKKDTFSIGGASLVSWLGDDGGKGAVWETARSSVGAATLAQWMSIAVPSSIALGSQIGAVAGTLNQSYAAFQWTPRAMIDDLMDYFSTEYRIRPNFTIDYGLAVNLFQNTPTAIATRSGGGRDIPITGLPTTSLDLEVDVDDYTTRVLVTGSGGVVGSANASTSYKDGRGNALAITRIVSNSQSTTVAEANTKAATEVARWGQHQQVTLASDLYDIGRDIAVGDWIYVYDPRRGLVDTTNQVPYRGGVTFPLKVRVLAMTWPVERGMGIYYRDLNGVYTDITNFIDYSRELPGVTVEIGATYRRYT